MTAQQEHAEYLFSYGTLQSEKVQLATFGRKPEGTPDALIGYRLVMITIRDEDFVNKSGTAEHRNLHYTGNASDQVQGTTFTLTQSELQQADLYEPQGYQRVRVQFRSGKQGWIYIHDPA